MHTFSWLFDRHHGQKKTRDDWITELSGKPDWMLENIVKNPGEFTAEMRKAADDLLSRRKSA
jgi:hypothetical protein